MSVLGGNGVELITKGKEVLVALLDLENLCFKLGDEEVLLVRSQMYTVVVLKEGRVSECG